MNRHFALFALVALSFTALLGWQKLAAVAASPQHRKADADRAQLPERLPIQPTGDAQQLQSQILAARHKAFEHGYYACCIEPPCSWCLLHIGKCSCVLGVGSGQWACRECHGGWEAGQGRIPGRSKEDVRHMKTLAVDERRVTSEPAAQAGPEAAPAMPNGKVSLAGTDIIAAGGKLFRKLNCLSCHRMSGIGANVGPDLTHEGQRHADIAWQIAHLEHPDKVHPGSRMPSFANLKPQELRALSAYLISQK